MVYVYEWRSASSAERKEKTERGGIKKRVGISQMIKAFL